MDGRMDGRRLPQAGLGDLWMLGLRALLGGIAAALLLGAAALALASTAQAAAGNDAATGTLMLKVGDQYIAAPTVETEVAIEVSGMIARTRLTQAFHNAARVSMEGVYVFPLPEKAAVDHLWLRVGERTIEGRIAEKEAARRAYEQAKRDGRKAALLEQQRPNLFTQSIAHIGPNEMVRVTIEYQQSLAYENGRYRLRFPLAVTPRYVPSHAPAEPLPDEPKAREASGWMSASAAAAQLHGDDLQQPGYVPGQAVNPVDIAVVIDAGVPVTDVVSSYHDAWVEKRSDLTTAVYLVKDQEEADHDFELAWKPAAGAEPKAAVFTETVEGRDYALLMVVPPAAAAKGAGISMPREAILVIDTSGSMQGRSLEQAKAALATALDSLTERDRFNVLEFNSVTRTLWSDALPATPQNLRTARAWVSGLQANGGTEMAPALEFALRPGTPGYLRQVVFMTDGAVGNEEALFRLIVDRLGDSRLFTVGIGSAPNGHFMTRAAQFGRGTFTQIGDVREVKEKMERLFAKIEAPVLRDVSVRWPDGTPVEIFPARVPDLYLGEPVVVSASAAPLAGTVVVSGLRGNEPWSVALALAPAARGHGVGALWARAKIATLMDDITRGADAAAIRPQVVEVALTHHLVSAYTSLVAVDTTPTAVGPATTALVPAALPRGWGGDGALLPQTDTPAALQVLLGLLALGAAALVAVLGRLQRAPSHA